MAGVGQSSIIVGMFVLMAYASGSPLFAQAGSTGGTVGKTDKSVSGGKEQRLKLRHSKPEKKKHAVPEQASQPNPNPEAIRGPVVLHNPTINGMRVDWCMTTDWSECGEVSASTLCQTKGLSRAIDFKWRVNPPTYRQGTRDICEGLCGAFTQVTCE